MSFSSVVGTDDDNGKNDIHIYREGCVWFYSVNLFTIQISTPQGIMKR